MLINIENKVVQNTIISKFFEIIIFFCIPIIYIVGSLPVNFILIVSSIYIIFLSYSKKIIFDKKEIYIFLIIMIFLIINSLSAEFKSYSLYKSMTYFRFILFLYFGIYFLNISSIQLKRFFSLTLLGTIIFVSFDSLVQFIYGIDLLGYKTDITIIYGRLSGPFGSEYIVGSYLFCFGFVGFACLKQFFNIGLFLQIIYVSLLSIMIFLTGERNAVLMSFIIILVNLIFNSEFRKILGFYIIKLMIIFSISFILLDHIKHRYYEYPSALFFQTQGEPLIHKVLNNQYGMHSLNAYSIFLDNKFLGSGVRSFRSECKKYSVEIIAQKFAGKLVKKADMRKLNNGCSTHPHNLYFELLAETGIFGLIFFLLFLSSIFIQKFSFLKNKTEISILASVLIALLFPLKPTGSIFSTMYSGYIWFFLAFYLAFIELKKTYYEK